MDVAKHSHNPKTNSGTNDSCPYTVCSVHTAAKCTLTHYEHWTTEEWGKNTQTHSCKR